MNKLPKELINLILLFDGRIKYRRGKYIDCIPKNDLRYTILSTLRIPMPIRYTMENDLSHPEHFEYNVTLNKKYRLSVWNVPYNPPIKLHYLFYKISDPYITYSWYRI
jgi:hypothetical protein